MPRKVFVLLLTIILGLSLIGCTGPARKPAEPRTGVTRTPTNTPTPSKAQPNMERVLADRFANMAKTVPGVKTATVVVSKNAGANSYTAMVGIELNADIKGTDSEKIKKQVADKIKGSGQNVTKVLVTTDPNLITRLKDIANGVIKGRPVSSFANEISELARRIAPTMK